MSAGKSSKASCVCKCCGVSFLLFPSQIKNGRGSYCSIQCYKVRVDLICDHCGRLFSVPISRSGTAKFCSRLCHNHLSLEEKFWKYVIVKDGCWQWSAYKNKLGYGILRHKGKGGYAHRISWEIAYGAINDSKKFVCHKCDNPECSNPDHLFLGTAKDNHSDMISKERQASMKGELNPSSKLASSDVAIILEYIWDGVPHKAICEKYPKVKLASIRDIAYGRTWQSVPRPNRPRMLSKLGSTQ